MILLLALDPTIFFPKPCGCGVRTVHKLVKRAPIKSVELKLESRVNMFGGINGLVVLQDHRLKNDRLLGVPLMSSYAVKIH